MSPNDSRRPLPYLIHAWPPTAFSRGAAELILNDQVVLNALWSPYRLPETVTWKEDPFKNRSWRLYYHALAAVDHLLVAYEQTGELTYLIKSRLIVESWLSAKGDSRIWRKDFAWNEGSVAFRTHSLIILLVHWQRSILSDATFETRISEAIHEHAERLADTNAYKVNNHGILQDRALISVAVLFPAFAASSDWLDLAKRRLLERCRADVSPSGVH